MCMMKNNYFFCLVMLLLSSCSQEFNDQPLKTQIDSLDNRLKLLEEQSKQMNTNIASLQRLLQAMDDKDYITSVIPVVKDGIEVGYTIAFAVSEPITIFHGIDGSNGGTPLIGVEKADDGLYYWTLDGEWLLDEYGKPLKVSGEDGTDGQNGITPRFKVENGFWYVSYDAGTKWEKLDIAVNSSGGFFSDVQVTDEMVTLVLFDGSSFSIPRCLPVAMHIDVKEQGIVSGATVKIPYTLTGATEECIVSASSDGNYRVKLEEQTSEGGIITVTAPTPYVDGYVNVLVFDGVGRTLLHVINFYEWIMKVSGGIEGNSLTYSMPIKGGLIEIPMSVNFDYDICIPEEAKEWVEVSVKSRAALRDEVVELLVKSNKTDSIRDCVVAIKPFNSIEPLFSIHIQQSYQIRFEDGNAKSNLPGLSSGYQD